MSAENMLLKMRRESAEVFIAEAGADLAHTLEFISLRIIASHQVRPICVGSLALQQFVERGMKCDGVTLLV